jgi:cation transport protein ChaC
LAQHGPLAWTPEQVEQNFAQAWAERPAGPLWVFGYGSLIWNPLMSFDAQCNATLRGWHRSFCLRSISGRGSPSQPGRMLSLQPGGQVDGIALRLPADTCEQELRLLWTREMSSGTYLPLWHALELADGRTATAIVFVAHAGHPQHDTDDTPATVAAAIASAHGAFGPNIDYLLKLHQALHARGLADPYIDAVVALMPAAPAATRP